MFKQQTLHLRWKSEGGYVDVPLCPAKGRGDPGPREHQDKQIWRSLGMKIEVLPLEVKEPFE